MDPFTALSLAGNIIQFIDFGGRLLSNARELYKSSVGSLAVHDQIILVTADLDVLVKKLRKSMYSDLGSEGNDDQWKSLRKICDEASTVAEELLERLETLKLNFDSKHPQWDTIKLAIRSLWNEKEITNLSNRLATLKEALKTRVLLSLREAVDLQSIHTSARFNSLDQQTQQVLSTILRFHTDIAGQISQQIREEITGITVTVSQILSRLETMSQGAHDDHLQTRRAILEQICERKKRQYHKSQEVTASIEMLSVSGVVEQGLRNTVQRAILQSLSYAEMTNRYEAVNEPHPETFEWAFSAPTEEQSWSDFSGWLKSGNGVYWVSGKAGSGKSTFMKHLVDDSQNRLYHLLRVWARGSPLCVATFFFWNSGTRLQKSQLGLLRALLCQVLSQHPELIPTVFPKEWSTFYSNEIAEIPDGSRVSPSSSPLPWKLTQLKEAFRALSSQTTTPLKICFVVDGLDEFDGDDGDYEEMGQLFKEITDSKQVKVCLSSRPWVVFEDLFDTDPNLKLQNLTYRDIERYVHDKFYLNRAFLKLTTREPTAGPALLKEIVEKAEGVFLWVKLVVRSLLDGIRNRDDLDDLWEQLRRLPKDLTLLFKRLLELVEPYQQWASQAVQILRCNRDLCSAPLDGSFGANLLVQPITISEFSLATSENVHISSIENMTRKEFQVKCEDTRVRLTARCAGFLEVSNLPGTSAMGPGSVIQYFHRTAKDFLESAEVWSKLLMETENTSFNPNVALMRSQLLYIKVQIAFAAESLQTFIRYEVEASPHIIYLMAYAVRADPHPASRETQTFLMSQLNELIAKYDVGEEWLHDLMPNLQGRVKLLEVSTLLGLGGYVGDRLKLLNESQLGLTATSLLQFFLRHGQSMVTGSPHRSLEMLSLLLDSGADVGSSYTLLLSALESAQCGLEYLRKRVRTNSEMCPGSDFDCLQRLYVRLEEVLANKQATPSVRMGIQKRLADVIEDADISTHSNKIRKHQASCNGSCSMSL